MIHLGTDGRVLSVTPADTITFPTEVAADHAGGVWFSAAGNRYAGHVDAAGSLTFGRPGQEEAHGVAIAPDGAAWFALTRCALARVTRDRVASIPAPVPARSIAFDASGALWLASERHLVRTTVAELDDRTCDGRRARLSVTPAGGRRISLAALRRDGVRIRADEPANVHVGATSSSVTSGRSTRAAGTSHRGATAFPRAGCGASNGRSRAETRAELSLELDAEDFEGNYTTKVSHGESCDGAGGGDGVRGARRARARGR